MGDNGVMERQIRFDFQQHHSQQLSARLWSQRRDDIYKSLPEDIQKKVDEVQSAASMLDHAFAGEANGQRGDIEGKRNQLYEAMIGLLDDPYFLSSCSPEEDEVKVRQWMEVNLLDVLFNPPAPEPSSLEVAARFMRGVAGTFSLRAKSMAGSLWDSFLTDNTENPTSEEASLRENTGMTPPWQADQTSAWTSLSPEISSRKSQTSRPPSYSGRASPATASLRRRKGY